MNVSKEEENFHKASTLMRDVTANYLRRLFKLKWNKAYPSHKWDDQPINGQCLWNAISRAEQKPIEYVKDKILSGNRNSWDCTILFRALLSPKLKLIPDSETKTIDSLRVINNVFVSHTADLNLTKKDFEETIEAVRSLSKWINELVHDQADSSEWQELQNLQDAINSIERDIFKTKYAKQKEIQIEEERNAAIRENQENYHNLPVEIENFVGREKEIEDILGSVENDEPGKSYDVVLIHGGPCLGKSALALSLAYQMFANGCNYIIWINMKDISNSDDPNDVPSIEALAMKILQEFDIKTDFMKDDPLQYLTQKFSFIKEHGKKAFLIFDNADSLIGNNDASAAEVALAELIRLVQSNSPHNVKMLFTSRIRRNIGQKTKFVKIEALTDEESTTYLNSTLKEESLLPKSKLVSIMKAKCEGMPLALKVISSKANSAEDRQLLKDYLEHFDKHSLEKDPIL